MSNFLRGICKEHFCSEKADWDGSAYTRALFGGLFFFFLSFFFLTKKEKVWIIFSYFTTKTNIIAY